jgi:hypothetical protein
LSAGIRGPSAFDTMTEAKQHHFVHEAFQARFTNDEGRLYFFDRLRPERGVRKCAPGNLFKQGRLNTVTDAKGVKSVHAGSIPAQASIQNPLI